MFFDVFWDVKLMLFIFFVCQIEKRYFEIIFFLFFFCEFVVRQGSKDESINSCV